MQPFLQQVYEWLSRYLSGAISLQEFQEWFAPTAWEVMDTDDVESTQLACSIELVLAEFHNGHWTENELKDRLQEYTRPAPLTINVSDTVVLTTDWTIRLSPSQTTTTIVSRTITTPRSTVTPDYQRTKPQTSQVTTAA